MYSHAFPLRNKLSVENRSFNPFSAEIIAQDKPPVLGFFCIFVYFSYVVFDLPVYVYGHTALKGLRRLGMMGMTKFI